MLKLRSLRASGDLEAYWAFHERRELQRNHLDRYDDREFADLRDDDAREERGLAA